MLLRYDDSFLDISIGNVYISDFINNRVRKITASTSIITTTAGTGTAGYSGDNGQATSANIKYPGGINLDSAGNVYFGDRGAYNVVRKITVSTGIISTVAGTGSTATGYNGDNIQATSATLYDPHDVVLDSYGNLYICDRGDNRIRKVDMSTGVITTIVGTGTASSTGDGSAATSATTSGPCYSRFDSAGNYYISECGAINVDDGSRIRKVVTVSTDIPTAAPSVVPTALPTPLPGEPTSTPSTARPTSTPSWNPRYDSLLISIVIYSCLFALSSAAPTTSPSAGPTFIPTTIPTLTPTYYPSLSPHSISIISTIAGTGSASYSGDNGPVTSAAVNNPLGIAIDSNDNIYIADTGNNRVRKVTISMGIITTIAGSGSTSFSGDNGAATSAGLYHPHEVCVTSGSNEAIYFV